MIIVCDNISIADHFHRAISGEEEIKVDDADDESEEDQPKRRKNAKAEKRYGKGQVFPDLLSNRKGAEVTLRIDTRLLEDAESENRNATRKEAGEELRRIVATVGKPGQPGENIRCVVSVNMLSEGWDANNVTHILGLRAFTSQLLCEQVVGRGLRRMDYTVDPHTGLLSPEYVDIFGVPFSLIPFKGREPKTGPPPEDQPKNEVMALPERRQFEMRFPIVEGYAVALKHNRIRYSMDQIERIRLDPWATPTAAFLRPQVGYQIGSPSAHSGFGFELVDRDAYYQSTHPQTIAFEIAKEIVRSLTEAAHPGKERLRRQARSVLFPQVLQLVQEYMRTRVEYNGQHPCEVGLQTYTQRIVSLLVDAVQPDDEAGETPLVPRLNRYRPMGTTAAVHFKTVKPVQATCKSHINLIACDTGSWEQAAAFQLEASPLVVCYARNDRLELCIPYELYGVPLWYEPDFLVRLVNSTTLILEVKGQLHENTEAKHQAAKRWVHAVNNWGGAGPVGVPGHPGPARARSPSCRPAHRHAPGVALEGRAAPGPGGAGGRKTARFGLDTAGLRPGSRPVPEGRRGGAVRVVLDTNLIVSGGTGWLVRNTADVPLNDSRRVLIRVAVHHTGLYSGKIIGEYLEKLIDGPHPTDRTQRLVTLIMGAFERVEIVTQSAPTRPSDPDDEVFLLCAIDGHADLLVTEDHALLSISHAYDPPRIGKCADLVDVLGA